MPGSILEARRGGAGRMLPSTSPGAPSRKKLQPAALCASGAQGQEELATCFYSAGVRGSWWSARSSVCSFGWPVLLPRGTAGLEAALTSASAQPDSAHRSARACNELQMLQIG